MNNSNLINLNSLQATAIMSQLKRPEAEHKNENGSGYKYFDLKDKNNNIDYRDISNRYRPTQLPKIGSPEFINQLEGILYIILNRFEIRSRQLIGQSDYKENYYNKVLNKELLDYTKEVLQSPYCAQILTSRFIVKDELLNAYPNNRINLIQGFSNLFLDYQWPSEKENIKEIILLGITHGLNPLEKSTVKGVNPLATLMKNGNSTNEEILDFFNSLHPLMLGDFSEKKDECIFEFAINNLFRNYAWLANNIPPSYIKGNIDYLNSINDSGNYTSYIDTMKIRADKSMLEQNINHSPLLNKAPSSSSLKV